MAMAGQPPPAEGARVWRVPAQPPVGAHSCPLLLRGPTAPSRAPAAVSSCETELAICLLTSPCWSPVCCWLFRALAGTPRSLNSSDYQVHLGELEITLSSHFSTVRQIILHSSPSGPPGSGGDIALVQLSVPVTLSSWILPVCLPEASDDFRPGSRCWVTGWGYTREGEPLPPPYSLQEVEVSVVDTETCRRDYPGPGGSILRPDMLCAQGPGDACQDDSGGPLVCQVNGAWVQAGIVSWGEGCGRPNRPGVYTRVPAYVSWIRRHTTASGGPGSGYPRLPLLAGFFLPGFFLLLVSCVLLAKCLLRPSGDGAPFPAPTDGRNPSAFLK
ncbi:PREDICTED: tryptase gamma isoform X2 [Cercocebus atys]|uniref:tryptase gamma isoform X2 n=1 Tax=Cercocebus atys TaxID=9531 RepID=UPI0005F53123|nr:PREDICTED: tryptase gamma isoform X2 [Cercocebus atys]